MRLHNIKCSGTGKVSLYSGAGEGEVEQRYFLQSWAYSEKLLFLFDCLLYRCDSLPNYMIIFESVITFKLDRGVEVKFVESTNLNDSEEFSLACKPFSFSKANVDFKWKI